MMVHLLSKNACKSDMVWILFVVLMGLHTDEFCCKTIMGDEDTEYSSEIDSFFNTNLPPNSVENELIPPKSTSDKENLVEWASRLELESITLKDSFRKEIHELLQGFQTQTEKAFTSITNKMTDIEKRLQSMDSVSRKNQQPFGQLKQEIKVLSKNVTTRDTNSQRTLNMIENLVGELLETSKQESSLTNKDNNTEILQDIKEYLRLLLPRIVSLERSYAEMKKSTKIIDLRKADVESEKSRPTSRDEARDDVEEEEEINVDVMNEMINVVESNENTQLNNVVREDNELGTDHDNQRRSVILINVFGQDLHTSSMRPTDYTSSDKKKSQTPTSIQSLPTDEYYYSPLTQKRRRM